MRLLSQERPQITTQEKVKTNTTTFLLIALQVDAVNALKERELQERQDKKMQKSARREEAKHDDRRMRKEVTLFPQAKPITPQHLPMQRRNHSHSHK